jgi:hypothetical protein
MDAEARFNEIADDLVAQNDDVELGKMFGMPTITKASLAMPFKRPRRHARRGR